MASRKYINKITPKFSKPYYEVLQTRKFIGAYGGVGSLVETINGAIKISPFNEWKFAQNYSKELVEPAKYVDDDFKDYLISDNRLLERLKLAFPNLQVLIKIPDNDWGFSEYKRSPQKANETISGEYFPDYMFCPRCRKFAKLADWAKWWLTKYDDEKKKNAFNPPKCHNCSERKRHVLLEQIRFILISPDGEIADIPWDRWVFSQIKVTENGKKKTMLDFSSKLEEGIKYKYEVSNKLVDLAGISIVAIDDNGKTLKRETLSGIFNLRVKTKDIFLDKATDTEMKVVIRTSNSVYYPNISQSIYLPPKEKIESIFTTEIIEFIRKKVERGRSNIEIKEDLEDDKNIKVSDIQIEDLRNNKFIVDSEAITDISEEAYRYDEYSFFTKQANFEDNEKPTKLSFDLVEKAYYSNIKGIANIKLVDTIKMTIVQTSYTRQEPISRDNYLAKEDTKATIRKKYTSGNGVNTKYLHAVETFGEGIFIEFDKKRIDEWQKKYDKEISQRVCQIQSNFNTSNHIQSEERKLSAKFILIHTFSHLIIRLVKRCK